MSLLPLPSIPGVPEELIRALNERFRQLNQPAPAPASGPPAAIAPANTVQTAYASGPLFLTGAAVDVPGATLTVTRNGTYLVSGVFDCQETVGAGDVIIGVLSANGAQQTAAAIYAPGVVSGRATVTQQWAVSLSAGQVLQLRAYRAGTGTSVCYAIHTSISAVWVG